MRLPRSVPNRSTFTTICQADLGDGLQIFAPPFDVVVVDPCFYVTIDPDRCVAADRVAQRERAALRPVQSLRVDRHDFAPVGDLVHVECEIE